MRLNLIFKEFPASIKMFLEKFNGPTLVLFLCLSQKADEV